MSREIYTEEDFQPDTPVMVVIPEGDFWNQGEEIIFTKYGFLEGDLAPIMVDSPYAGIRFENKEEDVEGLPEYLQKVIKLGARVFTTEEDLWLIVHSQESLLFKGSEGF